MQESRKLRVLILEDSEFDARILVGLLRQGGWEMQFKRTDSAEGMRAAFQAQEWDLVLSDYNMPDFNARIALDILQATGRDIPFIIISGGIGEDIAVAAMKAGANDYLMKGNLARLVPAVERELRDAAGRQARRKAEQSLRESEQRYRLLWETATDAVLISDHQSIIQFANPAVKKVFGYEPEELLGQSLEILMPPEFRAAHRNGMARYSATGKRGVNWAMTEMHAVRKDGVVIEVELSLNEMEMQGNRWFVGFSRDVTERNRGARELQHTQEQMAVAREIQQRLFPKSPPRLPGYDIAGASYTADAAGGDYYDYIEMLNGRIGLVVGDVTGHGIGPALLMAETRAYLRLLARNREDVGEILSRACLVLADDVDFERYVTLILVSLDPVKRELIYSSAGHPPCYVIDENGAIKGTMRRTGVPLGLKRDAAYANAGPIQLAPGDLVLVVTDGIEEAMSVEGEFFGTERLIQTVQKSRHLSSAAIVEAVYHEVTLFALNAPQLDDITMIVVKVT